jgi:SAM-dependent methyltransferase
MFSARQPLQDERFEQWMGVLEERHLANLTFSEVSRALRALSSAYVERRGPLALGRALSGEGKRAAFALFYGPLHYLLTRAIIDAVPRRDVRTIVDLGCGTGAAGAAWAALARSASADKALPAPTVVGVDKHPWALTEAAATYRAFQLDARVRRGDVLDTAATVPFERSSRSTGAAGIVAAFTVNELPDETRGRLLARLLERARRGDRVLVVEPLARSVAPWWDEWRDAFLAIGGRADEWRFPLARPPVILKLDRATGLDHRELTGRSIITS